MHATANSRNRRHLWLENLEARQLLAIDLQLLHDGTLLLQGDRADNIVQIADLGHSALSIISYDRGQQPPAPVILRGATAIDARLDGGADEFSFVSDNVQNPLRNIRYDGQGGNDTGRIEIDTAEPGNSDIFMDGGRGLNALSAHVKLAGETQREILRDLNEDSTSGRIELRNGLTTELRITGVAEVDASSDKRKQSLYFPETMLAEIQEEAGALDFDFSLTSSEIDYDFQGEVSGDRGSVPFFGFHRIAGDTASSTEINQREYYGDLSINVLPSTDQSDTDEVETVTIQVGYSDNLLSASTSAAMNVGELSLSTSPGRVGGGQVQLANFFDGRFLSGEDLRREHGLLDFHVTGAASVEMSHESLAADGSTAHAIGSLRTIVGANTDYVAQVSEDTISVEASGFDDADFDLKFEGNSPFAAAIAIPNLLDARKSGNESSAISSLRVGVHHGAVEVTSLDRLLADPRSADEFVRSFKGGIVPSANASLQSDLRVQLDDRSAKVAARDRGLDTFQAVARGYDSFSSKYQSPTGEMSIDASSTQSHVGFGSFVVRAKESRTRIEGYEQVELTSTSTEPATDNGRKTVRPHDFIVTSMFDLIARDFVGTLDVDTSANEVQRFEAELVTVDRLSLSYDAPDGQLEIHGTDLAAAGTRESTASGQVGLRVKKASNFNRSEAELSIANVAVLGHLKVKARNFDQFSRWIRTMQIGPHAAYLEQTAAGDRERERQRGFGFVTFVDAEAVSIAEGGNFFSRIKGSELDDEIVANYRDIVNDGRFHQFVSAMAGDDVVRESHTGFFNNYRPQFYFRTELGDGADTYVGRTTNAFIGADATMKKHIHGGAGNDTILSRTTGTLLEGGYDLRIFGGRGDESIFVYDDFEIGRANAADYRAAIFGGVGDDQMWMFLPEIDDEVLVGFINGGSGQDTARVSPGVQVVNVEQLG